MHIVARLKTNAANVARQKTAVYHLALSDVAFATKQITNRPIGPPQTHAMIPWDRHIHKQTDRQAETETTLNTVRSAAGFELMNSYPNLALGSQASFLPVVTLTLLWLVGILIMYCLNLLRRNVMYSDSKKYITIFTGRMPRSPAGATPCTDSRQTWHGRRGPLACAKFHLNRRRMWESGPKIPKIYTFWQRVA